ncbi:MAG: anti-sigma factor antagonist, partial [Planctomycetota bacterium]|nr:anti-sigma factor antagonist [Planctomycetota bacterium]
MRNLQYKLKSAKFAGNKELLILELHGFISASTFVTFERLLDELVSKPETKYVLLDFHDVNYINSSGIGALVAQADTLGKRSGALALARVHRNVGQTMQILGLTTLMHFLTDSKEALSYFESIAAAGAKPPAKAPGKAKFIETPPSGVAVLAAKLREKGPSKRGVLVVAPAKGPFTDTVKLWVAKEGANFAIVHDCLEALALLEKARPDLVILEDSVPGSDDFVAKVKLAGDTTLISIIKLYSKSTEPSRRRDFKIWENDFLIEPFEVKELFALSEVELSRAPTDRAAMLNQLHFTFKCSEDNVNKAKELGRNAIFKVGLD